jgi:hypothetical protein
MCCSGCLLIDNSGGHGKEIKIVSQNDGICTVFLVVKFINDAVAGRVL